MTCTFVEKLTRRRAPLRLGRSGANGHVDVFVRCPLGVLCTDCANAVAAPLLCAVVASGTGVVDAGERLMLRGEGGACVCVQVLKYRVFARKEYREKKKWVRMGPHRVVAWITSIMYCHCNRMATKHNVHISRNLSR